MLEINGLGDGEIMIIDALSTLRLKVVGVDDESRIGSNILRILGLLDDKLRSRPACSSYNRNTAIHLVDADL